MTTTGEAKDAVLRATGPNDVFGPAGEDRATRRAAKRTFRRYAFLLHPDRVGNSAAFVRLEQLYRDWEAAASRSAGSTGQVVVTGRLDSYIVGDPIGRGSLATVYRATGGGAALKIARRPASNRFLESERMAYRYLGAMLGRNEWLRPYYPRLQDVAAIAGPKREIR